jgi:hypothetical protein
MEELQIIGSKTELNHIIAKQHPEVMLINDLIGNYGDFAEEITEKEYLESRNGL